MCVLCVRMCIHTYRERGGREEEEEEEEEEEAEEEVVVVFTRENRGDPLNTQHTQTPIRSSNGPMRA